MAARSAPSARRRRHDCTVAAFAPDTRITSAPGELITDDAGTRYDTTNRNATFRFTGSDNLTAGYNLAYECRTYFEEFNDALTPADMPSELDRPFTPCESPKPYTGLEYGGHIFEVRAIDRGGNKDQLAAWHAWWVHPPPPDTTAPNTEFTSGRTRSPCRPARRSPSPGATTRRRPLSWSTSAVSMARWSRVSPSGRCAPRRTPSAA